MHGVEQDHTSLERIGRCRLRMARFSRAFTHRSLFGKQTRTRSQSVGCRIDQIYTQKSSSKFRRIFPISGTFYALIYSLIFRIFFESKSFEFLDSREFTKRRGVEKHRIEQMELGRHLSIRKAQKVKHIFELGFFFFISQKLFHHFDLDPKRTLSSKKTKWSKFRTS